MSVSATVTPPPGGWQKDRTGEIPQTLKEYEYAIVRGQVHELLTRYGQIDLLWFDGRWRHIVSEEFIRSLRPDLVIGRGEDTDFASTECHIPTEEEYRDRTEVGDLFYDEAKQLAECMLVRLGYSEEEAC